MPQSMSRVIARGRISARMFFENRITFGRQVRDSSRPSSHSASASATAGRSRKKWRVSTNCGVSPLIRESAMKAIAAPKMTQNMGSPGSFSSQGNFFSHAGGPGGTAAPGDPGF
jgi:hypothetical protein